MIFVEIQPQRQMRFMGIITQTLEHITVKQLFSSIALGLLKAINMRAAHADNRP